MVLIDNSIPVRRTLIHAARSFIEIEDNCVQRGVAIDRLDHVLPVPQIPLPSVLIAQDLQRLRERSGLLHLLVPLLSVNRALRRRVIYHQQTVHVGMEVRTARKRSHRSHSVERSHFQIDQTSIRQIHDLVVVAHAVRNRRDSIHCVVEGLGAQQMASDEIAGNAIVISLLRVQVVHGEGDVLIEAKRYLKTTTPSIPAVGS